MSDLFSPDDVISVYGDDQAVADGVLIDLPSIGCRITFHGAPVNRMTQHLFAALLPFLIDEDDPMAGGDDLTPGKVRSLANTLRTKLTYAHDTADRGEQPDWLYALPGGGADGPIWLIRNEITGWTVMFASDY